MPLPAITAQHALAVLLVIAYPAWDWFDTRKLRAGRDPGAKLRYYRKTIFLEWCATIAVLWAAGTKIGGLRVQRPRLAGPALLLVRAAEAALVILVLAVLLPYARALRHASVRRKMMSRYARLAFMLPRTGVEFRWYAALGVTAGICEEAIYRGFLIRYFAAGPWHWGWTAAVAISTAAFAAGHLYQGVQGLISGAVAGLIFAGLFLWSGNLLLPMAVHMAIDLAAVPVLRKGYSEGDIG